MWQRFDPFVISAVVLAAGCAVQADRHPADAAPAELPLAVSSVFVPSGYMGDGANGTSVVNDTACATRPSGARGECYHFTYHASTQLWSGVYWQFPSNNWGSSEG